MRIAIYEDEVLIGQSVLRAADPPMGVASGPFNPTDRYKRDLHARMVDGEQFEERGQKLFAKDSSDEIVEGIIVIEDYHSSLGELNVSILGIPYPSYSDHFSSDPWYRDYFGLDLSDDERRQRMRTNNLRILKEWTWFIGCVLVIGITAWSLL